jgi:hypothetical protein
VTYTHKNIIVGTGPEKNADKTGELLFAAQSWQLPK